MDFFGDVPASPLPIFPHRPGLEPGSADICLNSNWSRLKAGTVRMILRNPPLPWKVNQVDNG